MSEEGDDSSLLSSDEPSTATLLATGDEEIPWTPAPRPRRRRRLTGPSDSGAIEGRRPASQADDVNTSPSVQEPSSQQSTSSGTECEGAPIAQAQQVEQPPQGGWLSEALQGPQGRGVSEGPQSPVPAPRPKCPNAPRKRAASRALREDDSFETALDDLYTYIEARIPVLKRLFPTHPQFPWNDQSNPWPLATSASASAASSGPSANGSASAASSGPSANGLASAARAPGSSRDAVCPTRVCSALEHVMDMRLSAMTLSTKKAVIERVVLMVAESAFSGAWRCKFPMVTFGPRWNMLVKCDVAMPLTAASDGAWDDETKTPLYETCDVGLLNRIRALSRACGAGEPLQWTLWSCARMITAARREYCHLLKLIQIMHNLKQECHKLVRILKHEGNSWDQVPYAHFVRLVFRTRAWSLLLGKKLLGMDEIANYDPYKIDAYKLFRRHAVSSSIWANGHVQKAFRYTAVRSMIRGRQQHLSLSQEFFPYANLWQDFVNGTTTDNLFLSPSGLLQDGPGIYPNVAMCLPKALDSEKSKIRAAWRGRWPRSEVPSTGPLFMTYNDMLSFLGALATMPLGQMEAAVTRAIADAARGMMGCGGAVHSVTISRSSVDIHPAPDCDEAVLCATLNEVDMADAVLKAAIVRESYNTQLSSGAESRDVVCCCCLVDPPEGMLDCNRSRDQQVHATCRACAERILDEEAGTKTCPVCQAAVRAFTAMGARVSFTIY